MQRLKFPFALVGFAVLTFAFTLRVAAVGPSNSVCQAAGGCSYPCVNGASGDSAILISASQTTQCAPQYLSNCSGGHLSLCGIFYHYTGSDCDSGLIDDSYPVYTSCCGG
jgi:hypothetical protein